MTCCCIVTLQPYDDLLQQMLDARFPAAKSFHDLDSGGKPDEKTRVDMNGNVKRSTLKSLTDSVSRSRRVRAASEILGN